MVHSYHFYFGCSLLMMLYPSLATSSLLGHPDPDLELDEGIPFADT